MGPAPLLELRDIHFSAGGRGILEGLTLLVREGEVHALLGTNGTGKSTLAYLVMGCEGFVPSSGEILFRGELINALRIHERARLGITMAWQEPVRFEGISVRAYMNLAQRDADPADSLALVGLSPDLYLDRMVDRALSGGERKRIELASILAMQPAFAILDEPDSGIDMLSLQDIANVIVALKEKGASVLLITHREEIAKIADGASQLCNGKIIFSGPAAEVATFYKERRCLTCASVECPNA